LKLPYAIPLKTCLCHDVLVFFTLQQKNWVWKYIGLFLTLAAFLLPLLRLWQTAESTWNIVLGLLPWMDATGYYTDANRLLDGGLLSVFSGRRPLFASFLATLLKVVNQNLQIVLVIFILINGIAIFLFAMQVNNEYGCLAAVVVIYLLQIFYRPYVGTTLTEQVGLPLGLIAMTVLIRSVKIPDRRLFALGMALLTFALLVRAGTFFILPAFIFYGIYFFFKNTKSIFQNGFIFVLAVLIPFFLNSGLGKIIAEPDSIEFGNFSYTLYGQAVGGKGWTQVMKDYPELMSLGESERAKEVYRLAFQEIGRNPIGLLRGIVKAWKDFIFPDNLSVFGFLDFGNKLINLSFQILALILFLIGIFWIWREKHDSVADLILIANVGVFLSIPFLPPVDAGIRPYTATIAVIFLPVFFAIHKISRKWITSIEPKSNMIPMKVFLFFGYGLFIFAFAGVFFVKDSIDPYPNQAISCPSELLQANMKLHKGAYILLVENDSFQQTHIPYVQIKHVLRSFDEFAYPEFAQIIRNIKKPALIATVNDPISKIAFWIIAPPEMSDFEGRNITICAKNVPSLYPVMEIIIYQIQ